MKTPTTLFSTTISSLKNGTASIKVKPLEGKFHYPHLRRNSRAHLVRHDPLLLDLEPQPLGNSSSAQREWNKANAIPSGSIMLMLSQPVQVRAIGLCDGTTKTADELWKSWSRHTQRAMSKLSRTSATS